MRKFVVVGGGIVGIVSSILLKKAGHDVCLIEKNSSLGGLLTSKKYNNNDYSFDYGTHVPRETGISELDQLLFGSLEMSRWNEYPYLKVGNYFKGHLNQNSQFINTMDLDEDTFNKGLAELIQTKPIEGEAASAEEYLTHFFGQTFTNVIFAPLLEKLYSEKLSNLQPQAHLLFGLSRLICGDTFTSDTLKSISFFDEKLAFTSYMQGISSFKSYYPKQEGIGEWMNILEEQAEKSGVQLLTGTSITDIKHESGKIEGFILDNNMSIGCDNVIWTASPIALLKGCRLDVPELAMKFRSVKLFNFVFNTKLLIENHYVYCNEPDFHSYRITLYPNLHNKEKDEDVIYNCTVEVLGDVQELENTTKEMIHLELIKMGIISDVAQITFEDSFLMKNGFPVITNDLKAQLLQVDSLIENSFSNVKTLGKMSGKSFFMEDSLRVAYYELKGLQYI